MAKETQSMMEPPQAPRKSAGQDPNRTPTVREVAEMISVAMSQMESRLAAGSVDSGGSSDSGNTSGDMSGGGTRESSASSLHPFKVYWSYESNGWIVHLPDGCVTNDGEPVPVSSPGSVPTSGACELYLVVDKRFGNVTAKVTVDGGGGGGVDQDSFCIARLATNGTAGGNYVSEQLMTSPIRYYNEGVVKFNEKTGRIVLKGKEGEIKVSELETHYVQDGGTSYEEHTFTVSLAKEEGGGSEKDDGKVVTSVNGAYGAVTLGAGRLHPEAYSGAPEDGWAPGLAISTIDSDKGEDGTVTITNTGVLTFNEKNGPINVKPKSGSGITFESDKRDLSGRTFLIGSEGGGGYDDHGCFALTFDTEETENADGTTTTKRIITGCKNKYIRVGSREIPVGGELPTEGDSYVNVTFSGGSVNAELSGSSSGGANTVAIHLYRINSADDYVDYRNAPVVVCYDPV